MFGRAENRLATDEEASQASLAVRLPIPGHLRFLISQPPLPQLKNSPPNSLLFDSPPSVTYHRVCEDPFSGPDAGSRSLNCRTVRRAEPVADGKRRSAHARSG